LKYLIGVCVEQTPTPADRHTFQRSRRLGSAASRFQPLAPINLEVIRLDAIRLLRAMKNLLDVSGAIRLNEQIKRPQATRDRRKHRLSTFI
jgi:hypothetical protein